MKLIEREIEGETGERRTKRFDVQSARIHHVLMGIYVIWDLRVTKCTFNNL